VLNTVRSAAYLAKKMRELGHDVLHLSTALTPADREKIIEEVRRRLHPGTKYDDAWTLVATSCIECGMNFSFQYGFCELRSLVSYIQLSGRVSRNGEYLDSFLTVFTITADGFSSNRAFQDSRKVFLKQIQSGHLSSISSTQAVTEAFELECKEMGGLSDELCKLERHHMFEDVEKNFRVIPEESVTAVADQELARKICNGVEISIRELQKGSVRLRKCIAKQLGCHKVELPILRADQYDSFLGYMKTLV
jgi:CRISPR-associated endonuclease/helicase Cas3